LKLRRELPKQENAQQRKGTTFVASLRITKNWAKTSSTSREKASLRLLSLVS